MKHPFHGYRLFLWSLSLFGVLVFIFANSLTPATASGEESGEVYGFLQKVLGFFPFFTHHFVRKAAHFLEYTLLGAHFAFLPFLIPAGKWRLLLPFVGVPIGVFDELLQRFVPGRASALSDVLLDTAGYVAGAAVMMMLLCLYRIKEKRGARHAKQ